jgi:hypothetical protein
VLDSKADLTGSGGTRQVGRGKRATRSLILRTAVVAVLAVAAGLTAGASAASGAVLDVTLAGSGSGTVTSNPTGINCSNVPGAEQTACSHDFGFYFGTGTLTAAAGEGWAFQSWSGSGGGTCSGATNPCTTGSLFLGTLSATATFAPAPDPPVVTTDGVSDVAFPSAKVVGSVNPATDDFAVQECYVEYGLTTDYGEKASCSPKAIGTGTSPVAVSASIGVLEPGRTYHYRLVASNGGGTTRTEDQTFTSGSAPGDACPNAAIRAQQGALAQRLPNCGAYELVSPPFTAGQGATMNVGTADGNVGILKSVGGFADVENLPDLGVHYLTSRTDSGWKTSAIAPPASEFPYTGSNAALDWTRDGSRSLWFVNLKADEGTDRFTPIVRDPDGTFHVAGPTQDDIGGVPVLPVGTSEDLTSVLQATFTRPALTDGTTDSRHTAYKSLYLSTRGDDGQLSIQQVAYSAGATMFPDCGALVGGAGTSRNAVSSDGEKVFFTATCAGAEERRVWAKVGDEDPIDLSASQCPETCGPALPAAFRGASRDGSRVYFTTEQQLLPEDLDTSNKSDLYEYDFDATGQKLRLVTGSSDPSGANVRPSGLLRVSNDGAYVYFVATGRALAGENNRGVSPQPGANNLYVYHREAGQTSGTTTFVGALGSSFNNYPQASSTGRFLLLLTTADLTGERVAGDTRSDLYRYDSQEDEMLRVWTNDPEHNGPARVGGPIVGSRPELPDNVPSGGMQQSAGWSTDLQVSDDGSLVGFSTVEPLSVDDRNAASDGYLWEADTGRITLLTDGTTKPKSQFRGSAFSGMTPSGDSLFVRSATPLLRGHTSGQLAQYVIRRNGGFPEQALPPEPCLGDGCQGRPVAPSAPPVVRSVDPPGGGNVEALGGLSISKAKSGALARRAARLRIKLPAAGRVLVAGGLVRNQRKSTGKARTVTVKVALNRKARRKLSRRGKLRVRVRVVFRAKAGGSVSKVVRLTFKQPKAKKKGGR